MQEQENNQLENFDNTWSTLGKKWNYVKRNYHSKNGKTRIKVFWDWKKLSQILWTLRKLYAHFNIIKERIIVHFGNLISEI